jgi:endoglucanase
MSMIVVSLARARVCGALVLLMFIAVRSPVSAQGYRASGGKIYDATGQELQIRGISHFGFNDVILRPQYLWKMGWKAQIAQIKSLGFNAVRVPFVPDTLHDTRQLNDSSFGTYMSADNADLQNLTPLQALDAWMHEADRNGLYVLLDLHSVTNKQQYPTWFNDKDPQLMWNGQPYSLSDWIGDLTFVASRYADLPHFLGIDIYNEPNSVVRWSNSTDVVDPNDNDPKYFWNRAAESAAAGVLQANPNLLVFVQGINGNWDGRENSNLPMNWGEDFQPEAYLPLNIPSDKLVLSPHTYGPDVYVKSSFSAPNFPANLAADWETLFGQFSSAHPVVIGEWGGKYGNGTSGAQDVTWQNALVDYLLSKDIHNSFYWTYTPNSGDTGGILIEDDQGNMLVRQDKMDLLRRLWGTSTTQPHDSLTVFGDAMAPLWQLASWSATSTIENQFVKSGASAVRVDATTWGGLSLESRDANWVWTPQPGDRYAHLRFDVSAGPVVGATIGSLEAGLDLGWGTAVKISTYVPTFAPNTWYHVDIPIAAMNPQGTSFQKIMFQNNAEGDLTFYIDNVVLDSQ